MRLTSIYLAVFKLFSYYTSSAEKKRNNATDTIDRIKVTIILELFPCIYLIIVISIQSIGCCSRFYLTENYNWSHCPGCANWRSDYRRSAHIR